MDNFNLKKFLTENRLTKVSKILVAEQASSLLSEEMDFGSSNSLRDYELDLEFPNLDVFARELDLNPNDEIFSTAFQNGDLDEFMGLVADTAGNGDERNPLDGVYTKYDFEQAAKAAGFSKNQLAYLLDMSEVQNLERG